MHFILLFKCFHIIRQQLQSSNLEAYSHSLWMQWKPAKLWKFKLCIFRPSCASQYCCILYYPCADVCYEQGICVYVCLHVCNLEMCEEFGEKGLKICEKTERGAGTQLETDWLPAWGGNKNLLSSPVWDLGDQAQDVCHGPRGPRGVPSTLLCLWKRLSHFIIDSKCHPVSISLPRFLSLALSVPSTQERVGRKAAGESGSLKINTVLLDGTDT